MTLRLHDTATRSIREFVPLVEGKATMYQCGATVQSDPHIGHIRSGLVFDVLRRWLLRCGYEVTMVRNVTDIDDKILNKAVTEEKPWWAVAAHYERQFQRAYDRLGCIPPTVEPRATGHITQMIELVTELLAGGAAYEAGGDVYFDVHSFPGYGRLSGQRLADLESAADDCVAVGKRDPRDFALWKGQKPGEPAWPAPFGSGRPGWHLECSTMACAYLGSAFDIHGGGLDLVFPHHENEIAQAQAAGHPFARYWVHNAWVTTAGEKMSKSLGNTLSVENVLRQVRPIELRWYLISAHYRSNLEYSATALAEAAASFRRIESFLRRASSRPGSGLGPGIASAPAAGGSAGIEPAGIEPAAIGSDRVLPAEFVAAMNDDLGTPAAVAVLHETVTTGNTALAGGKTEVVAEAAVLVRRMLATLGVDPLSAPWASELGGEGRAVRALRVLVESDLAARKSARAAKDFNTADVIRNRLLRAGIEVEDSATGTNWSLEVD